MSMPCSYDVMNRSSIASVAMATVQASTAKSHAGAPPKEFAPAPIEAWYYNPNPAEDPDEKDPALPHRYNPDRQVAPKHLQTLGVLTWTELETETHEHNEFLEKIKLDRGYNYTEVATVAPGKMANYEENIKKFFHEHLHEQEEIRFILDGGGYEDVRDFDGQWIRIHIKKGDLIVLPSGMYHRFTLDNNYYVKAVLLYQGQPCRVQFDRNDSTDSMEVRKEYKQTVLSRGSSLRVGESELMDLLEGLDEELGALQAQREQEDAADAVAMKFPTPSPNPNAPPKFHAPNPLARSSS